MNISYTPVKWWGIYALNHAFESYRSPYCWKLTHWWFFELIYLKDIWISYPVKQNDEIQFLVLILLYSIMTKKDEKIGKKYASATTPHAISHINYDKHLIYKLTRSNHTKFDYFLMKIKWAVTILIMKSFLGFSKNKNYFWYIKQGLGQKISILIRICIICFKNAEKGI